MKLEKVCNVHGNLLEKDIYKYEKSGKIEYLGCRLCRKINDENSAQKNHGKCGIHGVLDPDNIKSNGRCKLCHRVSASRKRDNNREWFNQKQAKDRLDNPEKWDKIYKKEYIKQKEKYGVRNSLRKVLAARKLSFDEYEKMLNTQDNKCAICNQSETRKSSTSDEILRLAIDHCHKTNKVRGLLCHGCNTAIGKFKDDPNLLKSAINYLLKHGDNNGK